MLVWLASYPRSGNTLVRILLSHYFGLKSFSIYNDELDIGRDPELAGIVGHENYAGDWPSFYTKVCDSDQATIIKTHGAPIDESKTIYIVRDPRSVMVSLFHYLEKYGRYQISLDEVILGATTFGSWRMHLAQWEPGRRANTLLLRYEDITENPSAAVVSLGQFLGIEMQPAEVPPFTALHEQFPAFFRSGDNSKNFSELSDRQRALISLTCGDISARLGYSDEEFDYTSVVPSLEAHSQIAFESKRGLALLEQTQPVYETLLSTLTDWLLTAPDVAPLSHKVTATLIEKTDVDKGKKSAIARLKSSLPKIKQRMHHTQSKIDLLSERLASAITEVEKFRAVSGKLRTDLDAERAVSSGLFIENDKLSKRVDVLEYALEPRLKSIIALRPLRYALHERNRRKKIARLDQNSLTAERNEAAVQTPKTPVDLVRAVREHVRTCSIVRMDAKANDVSIALFAHDRADCVVNVLEALAMQDALSHVHVWIDGDQGKPEKRAAVDFVHNCVKEYPVKSIHRNRGNFGLRKMMLLAMKYMMERYQKILFLEDDCFPTRNAIAGFSSELDGIDTDPSIFSVYGHPFLIENEEQGLFRFQGWGWATTADKLKPLWRELLNCYLMTEEEYLAFVDSELTSEMEARINVTPDRQPTDTIRKFFAWDETLGLLAALRGLQNRRTSERLIYNFGAGAKSSHFSKVEHYRRPPFNMVSADEIWDFY